MTDFCWRVVAVAWLLTVAFGCQEAAPLEASALSPPSAAADDPDRPATAQWQVVEALREDANAPRHPSDGGGRAWLDRGEDEPDFVIAGGTGRFEIVYEVGPLGIATGGVIFLQISPFWGWSTPQVEDPMAPGYTTIEKSSDDIELEVGTLNEQLLGIVVKGRPLVEGDSLRLIFGDGVYGAVVDRFAEKNSRFWIAVDGDGDGVRAFLPDSPGIDVHPRNPAQLVVTVPTTARPGEEVAVHIALLDDQGSTGHRIRAELTFEDLPPGVSIESPVELIPEDLGRKTVTLRATEPGVVRLRVNAGSGLVGESNPLVVSADGPRILWADLHGHTALSDGTGTPEDYFLYARDVAGLDAVALTDHDHWGILSLDAHPELWEQIRSATRRFNEPGRFVTLLGFEWTSWIHGHRHVLYFSDEGEVISSVDEATESPTQLWQALEGQSALTFAHHSAGGPIATNWEIPPDPHFEPVTEIASVHGSSEAMDSPLPIYRPLPGNFVRDVLDRGYRFGFIGSGDSHDGHPGLANLASPSGSGLAAILSEERTREGVLAALRERRVYATNGPRILLRTALGAHRMGSVVPVPPGGTVTEELFVRVVAPVPLERVDLIRSGKVADSIDTEGRVDVTLQRLIKELRAGEYLYVRAVQKDGGAAWSSPIYFE
jgi:hypothetical protein